MKKKQLFTLLLVAIFFITMCGFFGPKKWIRAGDKAMAAKKYKDAIAHYQKAGPDAKDKLIEACMASYGACFTEDSGEDDRYIKRHEWLQRDLASVMDEEEITWLVITKLEEKLNLFNEKLYDPNVTVYLLDANIIREDCNEMLAFLNTIDNQIQGYQTFQQNIYNAKGMASYKGLEENAKNPYNKDDLQEDRMGWTKLGEEKERIAWYNTIQEMLSDWSKSKTGTGAEVIECLENFKQGEFESASSKLMSLLPNKDVAIWILNTVEIEDLSTDFSKLLEYNKFMRSLTMDVQATELKDVLQGMDTIQIALQGEDGSIGLTEAHKQQLKEITGTNPNGKILIIHNRNDWEDHVDLYNKLMLNLPDQYYPENLESVEFIIELKYDQESVGKYTDGSSAIRPDAIVTAYKAPRWNKIYSATEKGSVKTFVYGNESRDNKPNIYAAVEAAIAKIETQLK